MQSALRFPCYHFGVIVRVWGEQGIRVRTMLTMLDSDSANCIELDIDIELERALPMQLAC